MSLTLQILLIIFTVLFFIILVKNVKKGKLRTDYALAWILCSIALIILSIFPQIAFFVARLIGVISTANIVFAAIIFMLIILVYVLFNKVSMLHLLHRRHSGSQAGQVHLGLLCEDGERAGAPGCPHACHQGYVRPAEALRRQEAGVHPEAGDRHSHPAPHP